MKTGYLCRKPVTSTIWRLPYARDFGMLAPAEITGVQQSGCGKTVMSRYFGRQIPKSCNNDKSRVYSVTPCPLVKPLPVQKLFEVHSVQVCSCHHIPFRRWGWGWGGWWWCNPFNWRHFVSLFCSGALIL